MSQTFLYDAADLGDTVVRLGSEAGFTESADLGNVAHSTVILDDPDGTVGVAADLITGLKDWAVEESTASPLRIFSGYVGQRTYRRGDASRPSLRTGVGKEIEVELEDLNASLSFYVITSAGDRPEENADDRLAWLLGSGFLPSVTDLGLINCPATLMDAQPAPGYEGQSAYDVLSDIAIHTACNFFAYWDEGTASAGLFFDNSNTSTAYSSSLRLTNILDDVDDTTTFGAQASLVRDPTNLFRGAYGPYANGARYRTRSAPFPFRDGVAPSSNVKAAATMDAILDQFLLEHAIEADILTITYEVPAQYVNDLRAGQRFECAFEHTPKYESYTWFRAITVSKAQDKETDQRYTVTVIASPQETVKYAQFRAVETGSTTTLSGSYSTANPTVTAGSLPTGSTTGGHARADWSDSHPPLDNPAHVATMDLQYDTTTTFDPYECTITFRLDSLFPSPVPLAPGTGDLNQRVQFTLGSQTFGGHPMVGFEVARVASAFITGDTDTVDIDLFVHGVTSFVSLSPGEENATVTISVSRTEGTASVTFGTHTRSQSGLTLAAQSAVAGIHAHWIGLDQWGAASTQTYQQTFADVVIITPLDTYRTYQFVDESGDAQEEDSWLWDFDDGDTSTLQNPSHAYAEVGPHDVALTVTWTDTSTDSVTHTVP